LPPVAELEGRRDQLFVGALRCLRHGRLDLRVALRGLEHCPYLRMSCLLSRQRRRIVEHERQRVHKRIGRHPFLFFVAR